MLSVMFILALALVFLRGVGSAERGNRLGLQRPVDLLHDPDELCAQVAQLLPPPCVGEVDFLPRRRRGAGAALGTENAVAAARRRFHDLLRQLKLGHCSPGE